MNESLNSDAHRRLARIAGQVTGIQKMVDEGRYCVDILTQVAAMRAALDQLGLLLLTSHIEECVYGSVGKEGEEGCSTGMTHDQRIDEIRVTLNRFLK